MIKLFPENLLFTKSFLCICMAVESMDKKVEGYEAEIRTELRRLYVTNKCVEQRSYIWKNAFMHRRRLDLCVCEHFCVE